MIALANDTDYEPLQVDRSMMKDEYKEEEHERKQQIGHYPSETSSGSQVII